MVIMDPYVFFNHPVFQLWIFAWKTILWWYPLLAVYLLWKVYFVYIQTNWLKNLSWYLLEIKIPKEISKSPKAMEVILTQLHQTSEGPLSDRYVKGRTRPWFSLEMASFGGDIHFYIRTEAKFRNLVESIVYSQYPGVEVSEAEDYVYRVPFNMPGSDWDIWGIEFALTKPDAYPIKTYIDYGLDKDPKEEFKIDPLTSVLELLGSIGPKEQIWVQIPIMAARDRYPKPGYWFKKQSWKDIGRAEIKKLTESEKKDDLFGKIWRLTPGERAVIEAVEKSLSKYGFDAGYRMLYLAPKDYYVGTNVPRLISSVKQYGSEDLNGFKPGVTTSFDYPWEDFMNIRLNKLKRRIFRDYCQRNYFYFPARSKILIFNTEELATLYHFPGLVASTPTLDRIASKRGEPPANLPI